MQNGKSIVRTDGKLYAGRDGGRRARRGARVPRAVCGAGHCADGAGGRSRRGDRGLSAARHRPRGGAAGPVGLPRAGRRGKGVPLPARDRAGRAVCRARARLHPYAPLPQRCAAGKPRGKDFVRRGQAGFRRCFRRCAHAGVPGRARGTALHARGGRLGFRRHRGQAALLFPGVQA